MTKRHTEVALHYRCDGIWYDESIDIESVRWPLTFPIKMDTQKIGDLRPLESCSLKIRGPFGAKVFAKKIGTMAMSHREWLVECHFPKKDRFGASRWFLGVFGSYNSPQTNMTGWKSTNLRSSIFRFCIVPLHEWFWLLFDWSAASVRMLSEPLIKLQGGIFHTST